MDAVKEMGELPYVAALSEQEIVIQTLTEGEQGEEIPPDWCWNMTKRYQIWEAEPFFLICEGKERFYVLPKKALYDESDFCNAAVFTAEAGKAIPFEFLTKTELFHVKQCRTAAKHMGNLQNEK